MNQRSLRPLTTIAAVITLLFASAGLQAQGDGIPRTEGGRPDLSGTYDAATLTPLSRPKEFGDNLELTAADASRIVEENRQRIADRSENRGPVEDAPPQGGAPPIGIGEEFSEASGAGNVGGYNNFWVDPGEDVFSVDGKFRTSIIVDPKNGQMPPPTEAAIERLVKRRKLRRPNDGTAWWSDVEGPGPYDGPESLGISERCILGFTGAAPTFPSLYNNYKRVVQTEDHIVIVIEMVHDARVIRMNSEHPPASQRSWLGDSIGWWEGDTLIVDTTNFTERTQTRGGSPNTHITERITMQPDGNLLYNFTVDDPTSWVAPWTGEYVWRASDEMQFEYACHEGNYSMEGILKGARLLEKEWLEKKGSSSRDD